MKDKLRVYTLARQLKVTAQAILDRCTAEGLTEVRTHMSALSPGLEATLREWFSSTNDAVSGGEIDRRSDEDAPEHSPKPKEPDQRSAPAVEPTARTVVAKRAILVPVPTPHRAGGMTAGQNGQRRIRKTRCRPRLNEKSVRALECIAEGRGYDEILEKHPELTLLDIFAAAREALGLLGDERADYAARLDRIRERHPRAYFSWTAEDDAYLQKAIEDGDTVAEIAAALQKQPSGVRHRMTKLGMLGTQP